MKKYLLIALMILAICLVGCEENNIVEVVEDSGDNQIESVDNSNAPVLFEKIMYAQQNPNRDFSKYNKSSDYFNMEARVGSKNDPIKIGEVGIASATTPEIDDDGKYDWKNQYGCDYFVKVIRKLSQEELNRMVEGSYRAKYLFTEDSVLQGVLLEIDFNDNPFFLDGIKENSDRRDTILESSSPSIEDGNYNFLKDHIIVIPYDSENIEDNKMCIIWSISDYSAKDGLLSLGGYVGKTSNPEDYFYSFFEI